MGIAATGTGFGMLAVPPLCAFLIEHFGWRTAVLALAGISGVGLAMSAMLVRPAPRRSAPSLSEPFSLLIGSRAFVQIYISWVVGTTALFIALVFLPSFAVSRGADPVAASLLISAIGGASVLGRLGVGYAATDLRALFFYKTAVLAMAASYAIWLFLTDYNWLLVFASVLGIAYGVRIALVAPVLIALFGTNRLGGLLGTFFTATGAVQAQDWAGMATVSTTMGAKAGRLCVGELYHRRASWLPYVCAKPHDSRRRIGEWQPIGPTVHR